mmetsp:Transcript_14391/g.27652  ORF Transcript_14391/g.27652 Transcript_14391/m.27652 type:complete len:239 (+) Transcript_14391:572-1288(+)
MLPDTLRHAPHTSPSQVLLAQHPVLGGDLVQQGSAENSSAAAVEPVGSSVVGAVAVPVEQRRLGARRRRRLSDAEVRLVSLEDDWVRARGLTSQRGALASAVLFRAVAAAAHVVRNQVRQVRVESAEGLEQVAREEEHVVVAVHHPLPSGVVRVGLVGQPHHRKHAPVPGGEAGEGRFFIWKHSPLLPLGGAFVLLRKQRIQVRCTVGSVAVPTIRVAVILLIKNGPRHRLQTIPLKN